MRNPIKLSYLALMAAVAAFAPSSAVGQAPPHSLFFVRNNTAVGLTCYTQRDAREAWSARFRIPSGGEWSRNDPSATVYRIRCLAPVRRVTYRLDSGERYSFLRDRPGAEIRLRRIVPGGGR